MELLDFINEHNDWQEILSNPPYNLQIKIDYPYYLLKYDMIESDLSNPIVQQARGSIFTYDENELKWKCVCYPFDKFFNYGESNASKIDWENSPAIYDKIDGSLIKIWYYNNFWHISTNGTINAENADVEGFDGTLNYLTLVKSAINKHKKVLKSESNTHTKSKKCENNHRMFYKFVNALDSNYTYMFELVSPSTRLVVKYNNTELYALSKRNMVTLKEEPFTKSDYKIFKKYGVMLPKTFNFTTIEETIENAKKLTIDNEGFVVCDKDFHRIKIKGDEYLKAFKIRGNLKLTKKKVIQAIVGGYVDDLIGFFGDDEKVIDTIDEYKLLKAEFESAWNHISQLNLETRKEKAEEIKKLGIYSSFCFAKLKTPGLSVDDFFKNMQIDKLVALFD